MTTMMRGLASRDVGIRLVSCQNLTRKVVASREMLQLLICPTRCIFLQFQWIVNDVLISYII